MRLFQCDWCEKQKPCRPMVVDGKSYDICLECRAEIDSKLKGKGEVSASPVKQMLEQFGKQPSWPERERPWTLGEHPLIGKSDREKYVSGGILTGRKLQ